MAYEIKNGQGNIFKNKKESDNHPDYKGRIKTPEGKEYDIALWVKEGQKGKFFSVKTQEPYVSQSGSQEPSETENSDDLPF